MGAVFSCLNRWLKRYPGGPLVQAEIGKTLRGSLVYSLSQAGATAVGTTSPYGAGVPAVSSTQAGGTTTKDKAGQRRESRRHPTYATKLKTADTDVSEFDEDAVDQFTEDEEDTMSTKDLQKNKILEFRKLLTKVVKLKTSLFQETVKVTCTKDGAYIEWYKGKNKDETIQPTGFRKAAGQFPIDKVTNLKAKVDNPKALEISLNLPPQQNYLFLFKTREERELWQTQLEALRKFMALK